MLFFVQSALAVSTGMGVVALTWGATCHDSYIHGTEFSPQWQQGFWTGVMFCGCVQMSVSLMLFGLTMLL